MVRTQRGPMNGRVGGCSEDIDGMREGILSDCMGMNAGKPSMWGRGFRGMGKKEERKFGPDWDRRCSHERF